MLLSIKKNILTLLFFGILLQTNAQIYKHSFGLYFGKEVGVSYKHFFNNKLSMQCQYGEMTIPNEANTVSHHGLLIAQLNNSIIYSLLGTKNGFFSIYGVGLALDTYQQSFTDPFHVNWITSHSNTYTQGKIFSIATMLGVEFPLVLSGDQIAQKYLKHLSLGFELIPQIALHPVNRQDRFYYTLNTHIRYIFGLRKP